MSQWFRHASPARLLQPVPGGASSPAVGSGLCRRRHGACRPRGGLRRSSVQPGSSAAVARGDRAVSARRGRLFGTQHRQRRAAMLGRASRSAPGDDNDGPGEQRGPHRAGRAGDLDPALLGLIEGLAGDVHDGDPGRGARDPDHQVGKGVCERDRCDDKWIDFSLGIIYRCISSDDMCLA